MSKVFKKSSFFKADASADLIKTFLVKIPCIYSEYINNFEIINNGDSGILLTASFVSEIPPSSIYENLLGKFVETDGQKQLTDSENIEQDSVIFFLREDSSFSEQGLSFQIDSKNIDVFSGENCIVEGTYKKIN